MEADNNSPPFEGSKLYQKRPSKMDEYETNIENYEKNKEFAREMIDPRGIVANGIYVSFSGVIECAEMFNISEDDLQVEYEIQYGQEWHDQTPEVQDTKGVSIFAESKQQKITFSLSFDTLLSCMYITSWPTLLLKFKGFSNSGELVPKGYAQIVLPIQTGICTKTAYIYQIYRAGRWYENLPFFQKESVEFDKDDYERIIVKGQGRQNQKIRSIGTVFVKCEALLRNFNKFGYR